MYRRVTISRKRCNIGRKLVLITNRKSHELSIGTKIGDLEWPWMTLNGVIAVILRYFSEFGSFRGTLRKLKWLKIYLNFVRQICSRKHLVFSVYQLRWYDAGNPSIGGIKRRRGSQNIAILDLSKAISRKLITNRKSYMNFRLVRISVTFNDLERRNGPYFALFHRIRVRYVAVKPLADLTGGHTCSGRRCPCLKRPRRPHGRCAQEVHKMPCYSHKTQNLHC